MLEQVSPSIWMWSEIHGEARGEVYPFILLRYARLRLSMPH